MKTLTFLTFFILFFAVVSCYSQECREQIIPDGLKECEESNIPIDVPPVTLPVFLLQKATVNPSDVEQLSRLLLDNPDFNIEVQKEKDSLNVKVQSSILEVSTKTRGIWFADKSQLWNPSRTPTLLPTNRKAKALADRLLGKIFPERGRYLSTSFSNFGKTLLSRYEIRTKKRTDKQLDIQVNYVTRVKPTPESKPLPVVGGGGEFNFTFGDRDQLIGFSGVSRNIDKKVRDYKVITKDDSDKRFKEIMHKRKMDPSFTSYLAYYMAPSFKEQEFLYPVYVYHSSTTINNEKVPYNIVVLPATTFGPEPLPELIVEPRSDDDSTTMRAESTVPETDDTAEGQHEVGVEWFDDAELDNTGRNATDFLTALTKAGWKENFNWGDTNAWERDWNANDDLWVDAADIVFYAGHASLSYWLLNTPDNTLVQSAFVGTDPESPGGDLWGNQDLEWIIINACGPLEDDCLNGGGSAFERWKGSFDGLHQLLGYGSSVLDWGLEGGKAADYMLNGDPIIDSWFRAAREVQDTCNGEFPPYGKKSYAGVLYAEEENAPTSIRDDHLWGVGPVSADPKTTDFIVAMWTST